MVDAEVTAGVTSGVMAGLTAGVTAGEGGRMARGYEAGAELPPPPMSDDRRDRGEAVLPWATLAYCALAGLAAGAPRSRTKNFRAPVNLFAGETYNPKKAA